MPLLPYGRTAQLSMVARVTLSRDGVRDAAFVPVIIDDRYRPVPAAPEDPEFEEVASYVEWASQGLPHRFETAGGEIRVLPANESIQAAGENA